MTLSNALKARVSPTDSWIPVPGEDFGLGLEESEVTYLQPPACQSSGAGKGIGVQGRAAGVQGRVEGVQGRAWGAGQGRAAGVQGREAGVQGREAGAQGRA